MAGRELSSLKKVAGIRCPGKKRLAMLWPEHAPMGLIFFSRNEIGSELSCLSTAILRRGQGVVLGVRPSGQSDDDPSPPDSRGSPANFPRVARAACRDVKRRPTRRRHPAWPAPDTVCADYVARHEEAREFGPAALSSLTPAAAACAWPRRHAACSCPRQC